MQLTWKGETIETQMTDSEARSIAILNPSKFAQDIVSKKDLTVGQRFWLHKLAIESRKPKSDVKIDGLGVVIAGLMAKAGEKLKQPKILILGTGGELKLYIGSSGAINIYVVDGDYVGRITDNTFRPRRECPDWVQPALQKFANNPAAEAANYGRVTGRCCFCCQGLTTEESVALGYGPVCGRRYGFIR